MTLSIYSGWPGLLLAVATVWSAPARAEPEPVVHVDAVSNPDTQSYRSMLAGMDAFEQYHALAPDAVLRYRLYPRLPGVVAAGTTLKLQDDAGSVPIPLTDDLYFTLPRDERARAARAQVVANRRARSFAWGPDVRTPGLPANVRRLGDLRLECEIDRAATLLVGLKTPSYYLLDAAVDVCTVYPGSWLYYAERPVFNVTLVHGTRRQDLFTRFMYGSMLPAALQQFYDFYPFLIDRTYTIHIADTSWPDDTLVELDYMTDAAPVAAEAP